MWNSYSCREQPQKDARMNWTLDSYKLFLGYRCREEPADTVGKVFSVLPKYGNRFVPTEAYAVDNRPSRVRRITVDLADPEAIVRLGCTTEDDKPFGFLVTLRNGTITKIDWFMGHPPEYQQIDGLTLSVHRDHMQTEADARVLLALACDLQPLLSPLVGHMTDYRVEAADRIPFEYHHNSHDLPERIRWANFWGPEMVGRLGGLEKIEAAPAHEVRVFADGGVLLLSTPTLLTYGQAEDAAQRQAIWEWFDLERLHKELSLFKEQERLKKRRASDMASRRSTGDIVELRLKYPPTPEYASRHAALCVETAKSVSGVDLDYSVASLRLLDDIIERLRNDGNTAEQVGDALFVFGCYVGEVFVRHSNGKWRNTGDTPFRQLTDFPLVVQLGPDNFVNPIEKVFKRLQDGKEHNLPYFYRAFAPSKTGGEKRH